MSDVLSNRTVLLSSNETSPLTSVNGTRSVLDTTTTTSIEDETTNWATLLLSNATSELDHGATTSQNKTTTTTTSTTKSESKKKDPFFSIWPYHQRNTISQHSKKSKSTYNNTTISTGPHATRKKDDLVTLGDLQEILRANGYVRQSDLMDGTSGTTTDKVFEQDSRVSRKDAVTFPKTSNEKQVAFPQLSVLSYKDVTVGSTISGGLIGLLLGITIYPNLWLMGIILGGTYGYDVANKVAIMADKDEPKREPTSIVPRLIYSLGKRLAKFCLRTFDALRGIWFMYKTGQLSYVYYKRYATLDERFHVQDKIDAWNARFQQGKIAFDKWEHENEVGRKILASMRTMWLVQEDSFKKEQRRYGALGRYSQYRIVRYGYAVMAWCRKFVAALWNAITPGGETSELEELLTGIRVSLSESKWQTWTPRIGAAAATLVSCYCIGVMFAVAPMVLAFLAITTGVLFPTWVTAALHHLQVLVETTRAKGRREPASSKAPTPTRRSARTPMKKSTGLSRADKNRYHYYVRKDGTKQWYRTGQPPPFRLFDAKPKEPERTGFLGLWKTNEENRREPDKGTWRLWGS